MSGAEAMTEKQMRRHLRRIWFHFRNLQSALNDAHNAELIKYETYDQGPCKVLYEVRDRIFTTTEAQVARITHESIKDGIK